MRRTERGGLLSRCRCDEARELFHDCAEVYGANDRAWDVPLREMIAESIERANALAAVRDQAMAEIAEHGSAVFGCDLPKWALLAPDPGQVSRYRVTWFDERGFIGHACVATPEQGVECAFDVHRIQLAPRDTLDRIAGAASFLEGCRALEEARHAWESPGRC